MSNMNETHSPSPIGEGLIRNATVADAEALSKGAIVEIKEIKKSSKSLDLGIKRSLSSIGDDVTKATLTAHLGNVKGLQKKVTRYTYILGNLKIWGMGVKPIPNCDLEAIFAQGCFCVGVVRNHPTRSGETVPFFVIGGKDQEEEVKAVAAAYSEE